MPTMLTTDSPNPRSLSIGVILSAFNESRHLADVAAVLTAWADHIFIVDDASTDGTLV